MAVLIFLQGFVFTYMGEQAHLQLHFIKSSHNFLVVLTNGRIVRHTHTHVVKNVTYTGQTATIHQLTTMLSTSKNILFPGHNHLLTTSGDDPSL